MPLERRDFRHATFVFRAGAAGLNKEGAEEGRTTMGNVSSGGARLIAWTIVLAAIGVVVYIIGCQTPPPPPQPVAKVGDQTFQSHSKAFILAVSEDAVVDILLPIPKDESAFRLPSGQKLRVRLNGNPSPEVSVQEGYVMNRSKEQGGIEVFHSVKIVPRKEIVDDLRVLWSYERNFAHHNKRLSSSIEEMGAGFEMGANGYVLKRALWDARWEAGNNGTPAQYKVSVPGQTGQKRVGAYRFRIIPVVDGNGADAPLARVLASFPQEESNKDDACFVALCGPVVLKNDFTFSLAWPVYELCATKEIVGALRGMKNTTLADLQSRLSDGGAWASSVKTSFKGLEWPDRESGNSAQ